MTNIVHYCDANTQALYCIVKQTQLLTKNTGYYTLSTIPIHSTSPSPLIAPHLPTVLVQGIDKSWCPSPKVMVDPLVVKDKDERPQEDLLVVHCFCVQQQCIAGRSPWSKQVRGMWISVWPVDLYMFFLSVFTYCIIFLLGLSYCAIALFFCVFVVLVYLSVLAKWLARKPPLRTPKEIISTKIRLKSSFISFDLV